MEIPCLETERLILRAQTPDDWAPYFDLMQSSRSSGMGGPFTMAEAWGLFCHDLAQWSLFGHGALMLQEKSSSACVGQVGINHGPLFPECELGWLVYASAEGKGYAFEAAQRFRDWAFETRKLQTLVSYIDEDNIRSRRLAERLGAVLDMAAPRNNPADLVYRHSAVR